MSADKTSMKAQTGGQSPIIPVRIPAGDRAVIQEAAQKSGLSLSAFLRSSALQAARASLEPVRSV